MPQAGQKHITTAVSKELDEALEAMAERSGITKALLIRLIIDDFLGNNRTISITIM